MNADMWILAKTKGNQEIRAEKNLINQGFKCLLPFLYNKKFKNSVWSGQGTLYFPNGATYVGEWANGFMNGKGTFTWSDGKEKTGTWVNGKLQE